MDWQSLFDQGKQKVEQAYGDLIKTGVPAIQAGLEESAMNWLQSQNQATKKTLEQNVNAMLSSKEPQSAFAKGIQDGFQAPILKTYGPQILIGVVVVGLAGFYLMKKG